MPDIDQVKDWENYFKGMDLTKMTEAEKDKLIVSMAKVMKSWGNYIQNTKTESQNAQEAFIRDLK